uniref:Aminotransferase class I/classII large domain-containing protein n=1 Tax=Timspurckia oligopyrenoides TaxID=708627 RepID=A0A7S0ZB68_9RHOD|mmetsp:Transcript_10886/g.19674  ORF Transcript_10886/g.19674 Transcript_10886/m.19674 type:complete len:204 (+) Transcript_10886:367-978(+)
MALQTANIDVIYSQRSAPYFQPDINDISSKINQKTKAIVLVSPCNPTGSIISNEIMNQIHQISKQNKIWIILDKAYEHFEYSKHENDSKERTESEIESEYESYEGIISLYTMSKSYGMAGWRIGFLVHPKSLTNQLIKVHDLNLTHASVFSQKVASLALSDADSNEKYHSMNHTRLNTIRSEFSRGIQRFVNEFLPPNGGFYC